MQHSLRIRLSREPQNGGLAAIRTVSIRERLLRFLLGREHRLAILIPGDTVSDIEINQSTEGGIDENGSHE